MQNSRPTFGGAAATVNFTHQRPEVGQNHPRACIINRFFGRTHFCALLHKERICVLKGLERQFQERV
ncbi:hypothetical protein L596_029825 [Steinernema carpocapsae]|uniref:Uncharacterized protein n=1 Tax=Steinernema carpocapsae TaxID=34508 RepID=A0A4U5LQX8_STECR|nr:hypothetical protein L596_029825 [Steinernema carpocapsae]